MDPTNVRVHHAVPDIRGTTGIATLRAIVAGERDPVQLAKLSGSPLPKKPSDHGQRTHRELARG